MSSRLIFLLNPLLPFLSLLILAAPINVSNLATLGLITTQGLRWPFNSNFFYLSWVLYILPISRVGLAVCVLPSFGFNYVCCSAYRSSLNRCWSIWFCGMGHIKLLSLWLMWFGSLVMAFNHGLAFGAWLLCCVTCFVTFHFDTCVLIDTSFSGLGKTLLYLSHFKGIALNMSYLKSTMFYRLHLCLLNSLKRGYGKLSN